MKPGEYIGKDGRTYQWSYDGVRAVIVRDDDQCGWFGIGLYDWPAAKAALDALIEAEQDAEQWVELNGYWRISTDGARVQRRGWWDSDPWVDTKDSPELVKLYRAGLTHGREVAEAENAELRERVKALVDAILNPTPRPASFPEWPMEVGSMRTYPTLEDWHRIKAAAEGVQL